MPQAWPTAVLVIWALVVAGSDIRQRRVPDLFLLLIAVPALLLQLADGRGVLGISLTDSLFGLIAGFVLPFSGYVLRQLGAGDVKYSAVIGFLCGLAAILQIILISALALGLMSVGAWVWSQWREQPLRRLPAAVAISAGFVVHLIFSGSFGDV